MLENNKDNKEVVEPESGAPVAPVTPATTVAPVVKATPIYEKNKKVGKSTEGVSLINSSGKEVPAEDYFFKGVMSSGFEGTCGSPVTREDLLNVFNKVFKPADNILFYRQLDKEVYLVIIPIKYAETVGKENDSIEGDFQKHAISFLTEGQVNLDSLRKKLERINTFVKYTDR